MMFTSIVLDISSSDMSISFFPFTTPALLTRIDICNNKQIVRIIILNVHYYLRTMKMIKDFYTEHVYACPYYPSETIFEYNI